MRIVLLLILLLSGLQADATEDSRPILTITGADRLFSESEQPPAAAESWAPYEFEGAIRVGTRAGDRRTWFRFELDRPNDAENLKYSLYFWRYNMSLTVFMNGQELGGDFFKPGFQTLAWNHPMLVDIPFSSWQPGSNVFHIRFNPSPFGGTFADIKFAPDQILRPIWEEMLNDKVRVNEYLLVFGILISACTLVLYLVRRQDSVYLWFFGVSASWCVLLTHFVIYHNPVPYQYWLPMVHMAIDTWVVCIFAFVNRLLSFQSKRLEQVMFVLWFLAMCSHVFMPRDYFWIMAYNFHVLLTVGVFVMFIRVLLKALGERDRLAVSLVLAVLAHVLLSFHDFWLFYVADSQTWETASHLSQFGVPIVLAVFLVNLLNRFRQALDESERLNRELEERVDATRQALESSYQENRQLELRRAAAEERQKIYRDLHDDVGSKLLSIMHDIPGSSVSRLASSALESLREAVYRANYRDEPLLEFLTMIREETKLRAAGQGFKCDWFEDPDLPNEVFDAKLCYHLGRIMREAVSNALNHSEGSALSVSVEVLGAEGGLCIEVTDNGVGGAIPENGRSSGIRNIRERAELIDAAVSWDQHEAGGLQFTLQVVPGHATDRALST